MNKSLLTETPAATPPAATPATGEKPAEGQTSGQEQKPAEGQTPPAGEKAAETPAVPERIVPEKYELTAPDGSALDAEDLEAIAAIAKEQKWTNAEAQAAVAHQAEQLAAQSEKFLTQTKAHAEIGGDKLQAAQLQARAVLDKFLPADTPEGKTLRQVFDKTGYGNWTPLILLLARIGKANGEDTPLSTGANGGKATVKSAAEILYGAA